MRSVCLWWLFLFVSGATTLLFLASLHVAPNLSIAYLDIRAGLIDDPNKHIALIHTIGMESRLAHAVINLRIAWISVSALLMLPALLVGWVCRGDCLKLVSRHVDRGHG